MATWSQVLMGGSAFGSSSLELCEPPAGLDVVCETCHSCHLRVCRLVPPAPRIFAVARVSHCESHTTPPISSYFFDLMAVLVGVKSRRRRRSAYSDLRPPPPRSGSAWCLVKSCCFVPTHV